MFPFEMFNGGLVTARDPLLIGEGDFQRATNAMIRPYAPGIHKASGRGTYGVTGAGGGAKGLRYLRFDGRTSGTLGPRLVAYAGSTYYVSTFSAETGSFASLATGVGTGTTLDSVHFDNRYYLLNGNPEATPNRVVTVDTDGVVTTRRHGLDPVPYKAAPTSLASGGWPNDADFGDGYYYFFCTEVVEPGTDAEIESAVSDALVHDPILISGTTNGITVTLPSTMTNPEATHRRVYMVGPKTEATWSPLFLVDAQQVAEAAKEQIAFNFGSTAPNRETKNGAATTGSTDWTDPNGALTRGDGSQAKRDYRVGANELILRTFGFTTGVMSTVLGIEVEVLMRQLTNIKGTVYVQLSRDNVSTWSSKRYLLRNDGTNGQYSSWISGAQTVRTVGNRNDLWGYISWAAGSHLTNANFGLRVVATGIAGDTTDRIAIDEIKVTVYYAASYKIEKGRFYPVVVTQVGPIVNVSSANGAPPVASTGDVYEGQMLLNDLAAPGLIRASLPDQPDYFPAPYYLNMAAQKEQDDVTFIRKLRDKIIVGMSSSVHRLNFFPRAEDPSFERGRSHEPITEQHGIPGPHAAALFTAPGSPEMLAYANSVGIFMTNGNTSLPLTNDLEWDRTVNTTKTDLFRLEDYPVLHSLFLYYVPAGDTTSTAPTRRLQFCYHPSRVREDGSMKAVGPVEVGAGAVCLARLNNVPVLVAASSTAETVFIEDRGAGSLEMDVVTREIADSAVGGEARLNRLYVRHLTSNPFAEIEVTPYTFVVDEPIDTPRDGGYWSPRRFRNNAGGAIEGASTSLRNVAGTAAVDMDFSADSYALRFQTRPVPGQGNAEVGLLGWARDGSSQGAAEGESRA